MLPQNEIQIQTRDKYPTFEDFSRSVTPGNLSVIYKDVESIEDSVSMQRLMLSDINTIYSDGTTHPAINYIEEWLNYLVNIMSLNKGLQLVTDVAWLILDDYGHFYLTDLKILFKNILKQKYGKFYACVDAQRIMFSFDQYSEERKAVIEQMKKTIRKQEDIINVDQLWKQVKGELWEKLKSEGWNGDKLWEELEKRMKDTFPIRLEKEKQRLSANRNNQQ